MLVDHSCEPLQIKLDLSTVSDVESMYSRIYKNRQENIVINYESIGIQRKKIALEYIEELNIAIADEEDVLARLDMIQHRNEELERILHT